MVDTSIFGKPAGWLFIILFLLIFTWVFFAKDKGFLSQASNIALSLGEKFLPAEPKKELKSFKELPKAVINTQQAFIAAIKIAQQKSKDAQACLVELPSLSDLQTFGLEVSNLGSNINVNVVEKSSVGYLSSNRVTIENAKACFINAKNFHKCYIAPERTCTESIYNNADIIRVYNKIININNQDFGLAPYLINFEKDKFCFIPTHSHYLKNHCDADENTIDKNCLSQIKKIPLC